jgi:hypothetical protein
MGLFGRSKKNKERKEALASLKHLEKTQKSYKMTTTVDPSKALNELQPCTKSLLLLLLFIPCAGEEICGELARFLAGFRRNLPERAREARTRARDRDPCIRLTICSTTGQVNQEKSRNALSAYEYKDVYGRPISTIALPSFVQNDTDVRLQRNPISRIPREADGNGR